MKLFFLLFSMFFSTLAHTSDNPYIADNPFFVFGCNEDKQEVVAKISEPGFDINQINRKIGSVSHGYTPLTYAAQKFNRMAVRTLLEYGANVNTPATKSWTALHIAANNEDEEIIRILLEFQANLTLTNDDGHTPLQTSQIFSAPENITNLLTVVRHQM